MESLLLFRRALSSPTMCRFIPALSVTGFSARELLAPLGPGSSGARSEDPGRGVACSALPGEAR